MPRWRPLLAPYLRRTSVVFQAFCLCVLTFCVLLPLCCHRLLYSYYFIKPLFLDSMSEAVLIQSLHRGQDALTFWKTKENSEFSELSEQTNLLVTIVTSRRSEAKEFHYLLQVMKTLHDMLLSCEGLQHCADLLICDVQHGNQENEDAILLRNHFKVVRRTFKERETDLDFVNTFEKEKRDYIFCLRKGWELTHAKNIIVLEDDALPKSDFFQVVYNLLSRTFIRNSLYVKLYHPERLQRYFNPEPYRILEWIGLGSVLATTLLLALPFCKRLPVAFSLSRANLLFFTLYFMAVAELFGRHYLLELRRFSPQLYAVSPATECCTPGMLFPGNSSLRVADILDAAFCTKGNAKDLVLYQSARAAGERAHSLEPNLITHIGAFSSVRPNPLRPKLL
ncbi:transmembrane protein 246 isoform X2 [Boleophthalmus pectinirostris]|nr:transmembrane protein 246 isoform X2 [Boleophthalmus pectinirostris]XP_020787115.1 transmembrane protein 246 isoform X2 [Boleophthalmus pectinirostris]